MTPFAARMVKRAAAGFVLAMALAYLLHAAWHSGAGAVPLHPSGAAVALNLDPFVYAESQTGDGVAGCHFFCNHGCPVPPLTEHPPLPGTVPARTYASAAVCPIRLAHPTPPKAPPRLLA